MKILQMVFVILGDLLFHNSAKKKCRLCSNNSLFLTLRHHINDNSTAVNSPLVLSCLVFKL